MFTDFDLATFNFDAYENDGKFISKLIETIDEKNTTRVLQLIPEFANTSGLSYLKLNDVFHYIFMNYNHKHKDQNDAPFIIYKLLETLDANPNGTHNNHFYVSQVISAFLFQSSAFNGVYNLEAYDILLLSIHKYFLNHKEIVQQFGANDEGENSPRSAERSEGILKEMVENNTIAVEEIYDYMVNNIDHVLDYCFFYEDKLFFFFQLLNDIYPDIIYKWKDLCRQFLFTSQPDAKGDQSKGFNRICNYPQSVLTKDEIDRYNETDTEYYNYWDEKEPGYLFFDYCRRTRTKKDYVQLVFKLLLLI